MKKRPIVVYAGRGASLGTITAESLRGEVDEAANPVILADESDIYRGTLFREAALFVMPGGRGTPYCEDLGGRVANTIREFSHSHAFLGWCAGGYFGARRIEWHRGRPDEIVTDCELGLFPGTAIGSQLQFGHAYDNTVKSVSTPLVQLADGSVSNLYYHGGAIFRPDSYHCFDGPDGRLTALGRFIDLPDKPVCIAQVNHPQGGKTILCGVHFELPSKLIMGQLLGMPHGRGEQYAHIGATLEKSEIQRRGLLRRVLDRCGVTLQPELAQSNPLERLARFLPTPVFEEMLSPSAA